MLAFNCIPLLIIVILYLRISEGCRCGIIGEEARFCYAQFATIGTVTHESFEDNEIVYTIWVHRTLKPVQEQLLRKYNPGKCQTSIEIYTSSVPSLCGAQLEVGKTYLLAGGLNEGRYSLCVCHVSRELTLLEAWNYVAPTCPFMVKESLVPM